MSRVARFAAVILFAGALAVISPTVANADGGNGPNADSECILCWPDWT